MEKFGGIAKLREKSIKLTNFLEHALQNSRYYITPEESFDKTSDFPEFTILTPESSDERTGYSLSNACACSNDIVKVWKLLPSKWLMIDRIELKEKMVRQMKVSTTPNNLN